MMKVKKSVLVLMASGFLFGGLGFGCLNLNPQRIGASVLEHYVGSIVTGFLPDPTTLLGGLGGDTTGG